MKAISVLQPWAWAIATGRKQVENCVWTTDYRGPLAIFAGCKWRLLHATRLEEWRTFLPGLPPFKALDFAAVIAVATLRDVLTVDEMRRRHPSLPFVEGPFCLLLSDARRLQRPIPCKGRAGLFDLPDDEALVCRD